MTFAYTYRSSDGQRHTAEIEADSRDAAFAKVRAELGIKPIRVTAAGGQDTQDNRDTQDKRRVPVLGVVGVLGVLAILALLASGAWWRARPAARGPQDASRQVPGDRIDGARICVDASPLPRQAISGDRRRVEKAARTIFGTEAEAYLARFAEPGRSVPDTRPPDAAAFMECLDVPLRTTASELTEHIDLKRIVEGMKMELKAYLAGGGTVDGYLEELAGRQRREAECRAKAERRLNDLLGSPQAAYAYWLKANATLKSMGIYELPLPDALRSYQMNLDIDE